MVTLNIPELAGSIASADLFGGNVLATRSDMAGDGSYGEAINDMGVTTLRYPGGTLTEQFFDINNPDAEIAVDESTGETTDFIPLSDFMGFAAAEGHPVTIVIPTRDLLTDSVDANGDRLPHIDEDALRGFVHDVMTGVYGDAKVSSFEIGNEYWGGGEMNATEYGRLASKMATLIDDELRLVAEAHPEIDTDQTDILVQMGMNFGTSRISDTYGDMDAHEAIDLINETYGIELTDANIRANGTLNWSEVNNELIKVNFDTVEEQDAVDGIVAHVYSTGELDDFSKAYDLSTIDHVWHEDPAFRDIDIHVTEWNLKSTTALDPNADYGLYQAQEMLEIVEEFMTYDVAEAHVWPLIQNTRNALSTGFDYNGMNSPAEMFRMMAENLPGKSMLDFTPNDRETQLETETVDVHGFAGEGDVVFYITSNTDATATTELDFSGLIAGHGTMDVSVLGVADGQAAGSNQSDAVVETLDPASIYANGNLSVTLDPGEIMQVVIRDVTPTDEFAEAFYASNAPVDGVIFELTDTDVIEADIDLPLVQIPEYDDTQDEAEQAAEDAGDDGAGGLDLGFFAALLPLLALGGLA